jgi:DNA (cytosine-5)-methyltransferase 1
MRLLDLYCCQGGAAAGYARAGWEVVGVDLHPQPRYPFEFVQANVLGLDPEWVAGFDAIHASPPCQFATLLKHAPGGREHPNLIPATRRLLEAAGRPYVIENVEPARGHMRNPVALCGTMFGLGAQGCELRRHRLFETSFPLRPPVCSHSDGPVIGVYGGHARRRSARHGGRGTRDEWIGGHKTAASEAMGIDWMTLDGLSEAIPPAYTEFVGRQIVPPQH